MPEFLGRVYRIFRARITEDESFDVEGVLQIMRQLNTAIYEAQVDVYLEVTEVEP